MRTPLVIALLLLAATTSSAFVVYDQDDETSWYSNNEKTREEDTDTRRHDYPKGPNVPENLSNPDSPDEYDEEDEEYTAFYPAEEYLEIDDNPNPQLTAIISNDPDFLLKYVGGRGYQSHKKEDGTEEELDEMIMKRLAGLQRVIVEDLEPSNIETSEIVEINSEGEVPYTTKYIFKQRKNITTTEAPPTAAPPTAAPPTAAPEIDENLMDLRALRQNPMQKPVKAVKTTPEPETVNKVPTTPDVSMPMSLIPTTIKQYDSITKNHNGDGVEISDVSMEDYYEIFLIGTIAFSVFLACVILTIACFILARRGKDCDSDYPVYGVTGPENAGDDRLAHAAHMYHFQHHKQQMIAMERSNTMDENSGSDFDSDDDNVEGDYTVYECPGLATAGEMEVKNPMFSDEEAGTQAADPVKEANDAND